MAMASRYTEQVKQGVESLINCLICTDRFSDPKVLPCQHTFCLPCLEHFYNSYNDQRIISVFNFPCPQCRKSVYMPQGGLAALPNDFKVGQIQDVFNRINIVGNELTCDVCRFEDKVVEVSSFCAQCSKYLCGACTEQHSSNTLFRSHSTVSIGSAQTNDLICSEHQEVVKYFCLDCKTALCTVCALSKHSKHETIDLATAMDRNRANVVQNVDVLKENLLQYEDKAERFAALIHGRQKHVEKLKETMKKHTHVCIAKLREDEVKISKEVDSISKRLEGEIEKEIHAINVRAKDIKSVCDKTDAFLLNGGSLELVNKYDNLIKQLQEYVDPPDTKIDDHFNEELVLVPSTNLTIGALNKVVNENLADIHDLSTKQKQADIDDLSTKKKGAVFDNLSTKKKGAVFDEVSTKKKGAVFDEVSAKKKGADFDELSTKKRGGGDVLGKIRKLEKLANGNGASISITPDDKSTSLESITSSDSIVTLPLGDSSSHDMSTESRDSVAVSADDSVAVSADDSVAVSADDSVAVSTDRPGTDPSTGACAEDAAIIKAKDKLRLQWRTVDNALARDASFLADGTVVVTEYRDDSDKLQLFDPDGNLINCVACSAQNIIKPWGCAVNHQLEQIIVTDHGDRAVKVLDKDLTLKQVWRSLFDKPCGVAVMRNGEYVVTDIDKPAFMISVHTSGGIRKREFANKGEGIEDLLQPTYVTTDHHDRIIVSDAALNCIKIFDTRGKMLLKFHAANDPPLQPHGVCIDAQNNIVVADQSNNMISLFSSDGMFIKNIARVEDKPWGIAAHDNGSLAITTDPSLHMLYAPIIKTF